MKNKKAVTMQDLKCCLCKVLASMENLGAFLKVLHRKDCLGVDTLG